MNSDSEPLSLEYCAIDGDKACPLAQQLFPLKLGGNQGDDNVRWITFAEMLQKNKTLEQLILRDCRLSDEQACQIAQGLCCNATLRVLATQLQALRQYQLLPTCYAITAHWNASMLKFLLA